MNVLLDQDSTPVHHSGDRITETRAGSLVCVGCGFAISVEAIDSLPECPNCSGRQFRRGSIFDRPRIDSPAAGGEAPEWLLEARAELDRPGHHLAFDEGDGAIAVVRLEPGRTRIGRSPTADICLDDPTVSRRHALVVLTADGGLRALDDRSLNGLFVNGERMDWAPLRDGDELEIGRYRLYALES
jgi:hypothetical protein